MTWIERHGLWVASALMLVVFAISLLDGDGPVWSALLTVVFCAIAAFPSARRKRRGDSA